MTILQMAIEKLKTEMKVVETLARNVERKLVAQSEKPPEHIWEHGWEHGDVFVTTGSEYMICYRDITRGISKGRFRTICLVPGDYLNGCNTHDSKDFFPNAKFLFNIREKLCQQTNK